MHPSQEVIREQFYSITNIEITHKTKHWKRYALWLEQQCGYKIGNDIVQEKKKLQSTLDRILGLIEH
jgi:hypothetical protein